jgi:hypothetical protein
VVDGCTPSNSNNRTDATVTSNTITAATTIRYSIGNFNYPVAGNSFGDLYEFCLTLYSVSGTIGET